jgi:hypothetical protein
MLKKYCKATGSKTLLSLEKLNVKISYKEIMQSDDDEKTHTYISISRGICKSSIKPYQSIG